MAFVGMAVALLVLALGALLVSASAASLFSGGAAVAVGLGTALVLCVIVPLLLERKLTLAFRRLEPGAKGMFFQTLAIVNAVWVALLVFATPRFTRSALESRGGSFIPGASRTPVWLSRAAALIPRTQSARVVVIPPALPNPKALPPVSSAPAATAPLPAPAITASAIREAPDADAETPAGKVYRERAAGVVVIHARTAVPTSGPLAMLYEHLGVAYGESLGSGFVVDADGLIVTNHHVIDDAVALQIVTKDGAHYDDVNVLIDDARDDLALLSVSAKDLSAVPLSKAKEIAVGARAIAIGSPLGFEYTLTEGIVSAHRSIDGTRFLQMQTSIAPGSSGGPLFDEHGAVIGVNTATSGANMNLAVHVAEVKKLLEAPRKANALAHFVAGPRMTSLETDGGELDPTTRMNLRESASLLANIALKCAKPLPDDAQVTVHLPESLPSNVTTDSNLPREAQDCMSTSLTLLGMQLSVTFASMKTPPSALHITIADLPRDGAASGALVFHFKR